MEEKTTSFALLNEREITIVQRLAAGLSDRQIAHELGLSVSTVKWYNQQVYQKLGVTGRTQAIACVKDRQLLDSGGTKTLPLVSSSPLPTRTPLFTGRSREMEEVKNLLRTSRLLTLTGTGGIGKTQLALRVAEEVAENYADGVCFVDLAAVSDPALVTQTIASGLNVSQRAREPLLQKLQHVLAQRELLLLLDNFEQVIQAASLVSTLLVSSARLNVLVTSREPLRLAWEQEYLVPPLSLPLTEHASAESLLASEAGLLFVRRTRLVRPHFELSEQTASVIGRICTRLDGLPLALELAAARCKLFTPQELLEMLEGGRHHSSLRVLTGGSRDAPPRQQTLRDSIAWSYRLLEQEEQQLLARLAVFRGGCSLLACECICGEGLAIDVLDGLTSLVDKHLVQRKEFPGGGSRFVMLAMIQEYASEQLHASGEEENMRRRHAYYFVELAECAEPEMSGHRSQEWSRRREVEQENLRVVLSWSLVGGEVVLGVQLAGALGVFWSGHGHHIEGRRWNQQLLERLEEVPQVLHPKFLLSVGSLTFLDDVEAAKPLFARALAVARATEDRLQAARALSWLGSMMLEEGSEALLLVEEALAVFRELKHQPGMVMALNAMGEIARFGGDYEQAKYAYEECLSISQRMGEPSCSSMLYQNLAFVALHEGEAERARDLGRKGVQLIQSMNNIYESARALAPLAGALAASGQPQLAVRLLAASASALEHLGAFHQPIDRQEIDAIIAALRTQLGEEAFQAIWVEGCELPLVQAVTLSLDG